MDRDFLHSVVKKVRWMRPSLLLAVCLALTFTATYFAWLQGEMKFLKRKEALSLRVEMVISERFKTYRRAIDNTRGLFLASERVDRQEFRSFVEGMNLKKDYPGIRAIFYIEALAPERRKQHVDKVKAEGFPEYDVWPRREEELAFPVVFIEPFDAVNRKLFGFDFISEPDQKKLLDRAVLNGSIVSSDFLKFPGQPDFTDFAGVLNCTPLMKPSGIGGEPEARMDRLRGFICSLIDMPELLAILSRQMSDSMGLPLVLETIPRGGEDLARAGLPTLTVTFAEQKVRVIFPEKIFAGERRGWLPIMILLSGGMVSFLIFFFSRLLVKSHLSVLESENQLRLVADGVPALVAYIDEEMKFRFINRAFETWYLREAAWLLGRSVREFPLGASDSELIAASVERALKGESTTFETSVFGEGFGRREIQAQLIPDRKGREGVRGCVMLALDVSELKKSEEQLKAERRLTELISEVGLSLQTELGLEKLIQRVSDTARALTGADFGLFFSGREAPYRLDAFSGLSQDIYNRVRPEWQSLVTSKAFREGRTVRVGEANLESERAFSPKSLMATPLISRQGELLGGLVLFHQDRDFFGARSEKLAEGLAAQAAVAFDNARLYEESLRVSRLKDEFLTVLSHELRTPLNVIYGHAELLLEQLPLGETIDESVRAIDRNAKIQLRMINDLLDFSAMTQGKGRLHPEKMKPAEAVKSVIDALTHAARAKGVQLIFEKNTGPRTLMADPARFQQIVWSLVSNAVKFTEKEGHIWIRLDRSKSSFILEVSDDGSGVDPHFLPHIFDRFSQEDSSLTRRAGGLGLGLSLVKELVELHGGTIEARSPGKGRGTTFTVRLPIQENHRKTDREGFAEV